MYRIFYLLSIFLLAGCKDSFDIPLRADDQSVLVVEGVLKQGDTTLITISRSDKIGAAFQFRPVVNSQLVVEGRDNSQQTLTSAGSGKYKAYLNLVMGQEYRLKIRTGDGREYASDYVQVKETPPIDSLNWKKDADGVTIYVNTHDNANNTRYYKWEWEETWEYTSSFVAEFIYQEPNVVPIPPGLNLYYCWSSARSSSIITGSTIQLSSDVVYESPVAFIPTGSEKMEKRYSILVRQYALDKEGFEFLELMKKNSESLGSVFDAQPSELNGNIHGITDPAENVIGYITASTVTEKRIFITSAEAGWSYHVPCFDKKIPNNQDSIFRYMSVYNYLPWTAEWFPDIIAYFVAPDYCVDCRLRGGSNVKPSFW